jgi:hypothetical protein
MTGDRPLIAKRGFLHPGIIEHQTAARAPRGRIPNQNQGIAAGSETVAHIFRGHLQTVFVNPDSGAVIDSGGKRPGAR